VRDGRGEKDRKCVRAQNAIEELGDGHTSRIRWMFLRRHVKDCGECGAFLERMSAVVEALSEMRRLSAPSDFASLVMARLAGGSTGATAEPAEEPRVRHTLLWVAAASLGVAIGLALAIQRWIIGKEGKEKFAAASSV